MSNIVRNKVKFFGEQEKIDAVLISLRGEEEGDYINFEKIVPMPDYVYRGPFSVTARHMYGENNWYDWSIKNWGTKWNAFDSDVDAENNTIYFSTAWSFPKPVIEALAAICVTHNVKILGIWADEDSGSNAGFFGMDPRNDWQFCVSRYANKSHAAYAAYIELHGNNDCIGLDKNGMYVHYDCDNCPNKCW